MKLAFNIDGVFLGVTKNDYVSKKTGQPGTYYNVAVKQGGEVGTVPCTKDIYDMYVAKQLEDFVPCRFDCTYDDRYSRFEVIGAHVKK